jgi:hypothetical protein
LSPNVREWPQKAQNAAAMVYRNVRRAIWFMVLLFLLLMESHSSSDEIFRVRSDNRGFGTKFACVARHIPAKYSKKGCAIFNNERVKGGILKYLRWTAKKTSLNLG